MSTSITESTHGVRAFRLKVAVRSLVQPWQFNDSSYSDGIIQSRRMETEGREKINVIKTEHIQASKLESSSIFLVHEKCILHELHYLFPQ
jgi:hypothetical protein